MPKIQQELPTSSCEFHINASKIFQQFLEKPKAPSNLLIAVLQGIESRDLIVVNAWLETLIAVIPTLNDDSIRKEVSWFLLIVICNNCLKLIYYYILDNAYSYDKSRSDTACDVKNSCMFNIRESCNTSKIQTSRVSCYSKSF